MNEDFERLLAEILSELQRQTRILEALEPRRRRPLNYCELQSIDKLFQAITGKLGSQIFTVSEILGDSTLREVAGHPTPRALGQTFKRVVGINISGLMIERTGKDSGNRTAWRILKFPS